MAFTIQEVRGDASDCVFDIRIGDFFIAAHHSHDFNTDNLTGLLLKTFFVGRDESFGFNDRGRDKRIVLRIDDKEDTDHAFIDQGRTVFDDGVGDSDRILSVDIDAVSRKSCIASDDFMIDESQDISVFADKGVIFGQTAFYSDSCVKL